MYAIRPSKDGFRFVNRFKKGIFSFGLCGGMVLTVLDYKLANLPIPKVDQAPRSGKLFRYLVRRQLDSFGIGFNQVVKFARYMALPDEEVDQRSKQEMQVVFDSLR